MDPTDDLRPTFAPDALAGRTVLVTGAARGLGASIARTCADAGATVVLTDVDGEAAATTAAELGGSAAALAHDVADEASWAEVADAVREQHGGLDALVNNAGIHQPRTFAESTLADFERTLAVNLTGTYLGIQAFLDLHRGGGSIVNLSSVRGLVAGPALASYSASKFGVRGLTKAAAVELGPLGIRVNAVCPGTISSPMSAAAMAEIDEELYLSQIPLARPGPPRSIGDAVCWLVSDASAYVSGIELPVDGGVTANGNTPRPKPETATLSGLFAR